MEIISYVGASSYRPARSLKSFDSLAKTKTFERKSPKLLKVFENLNGKSYQTRQVRQTRPFSEKKKLQFAKTFSEIFHAVRTFDYAAALWIVATIFLASVTPAAVCKMVSYSDGFANPADFSAIPNDEMEFINESMARFAMAENSDSFDENGNVLSDDGKILTPASVGIGSVVSFQNYTVKKGESISTIAKKFGLSNISTLISVNDIGNARQLRVGQKIKIPSLDGIVHTVAVGQSLNSIAVKYNVSMEEILDANDLDSQELKNGQVLFIPGVAMSSSALRQALGELFASPITAAYRLTSRFGPRSDPFTGARSNHTGIDMACPTGTSVKAAMCGKVVYTGWSNIFGNYVIMNHGNGYQTLYGHMSKILCRKGQEISQGTRIGLVGSTGYSTGPHLHFTVYKNGKLVDPLALIK